MAFACHPALTARRDELSRADLRDDSWKLQTFSGHFHVEVMISALEAKMMRKDLYQWVVSLPVQVASTV